MRYFEIHEPYYALLKANNETEAIQKYIENVAGEKGETFNISEVDRDYALIKFSQAPDENKKLLPINTVINEFNAQENEVMIIDGSLI
ncbi:hypothetical protein [Metabacillus fastidiosus]|uniref:hypothetical protein n=1 Tax=Metabacillus fastidiosus TaxID=1458 RepID=UPI003D2748A2